jgi:hypothetical protein
MRFFVLVFLLTGCGGAEFDAFGAVPSTTDGRVADSTEDGGTGGALAASGGAPTVGDDAGSGGSSGGAGAGGRLVGSGGALATGGASSDGSASGGVSAVDAGSDSASKVPPPACCVDADCPSSGVPFCSPWGTCYQGGDPYNCDYDSFCESFCVHCSGSATGACVVTSAPGDAHIKKSCVCS